MIFLRSRITLRDDIYFLVNVASIREETILLLYKTTIYIFPCLKTSPVKEKSKYVSLTL